MSSSLRSGEHLPGCAKDVVAGLTVYTCIGACPAMHAYLVQPGQPTGEVDTESVDQTKLSREQIEAVAAVIMKRLGD